MTRIAGAALAVVVDANHRAVAVGLAQGKRSRDIQFALVRYSMTNGALDTSLTGAADVASAVALDGSGNIVAGGEAQDKNFALARYLP